MKQNSRKFKPMMRLTKEQIKHKQEQIRRYMEASNAADGSLLDANANVSVKTVSTMGAELQKDICIQVNRQTVYDYIQREFGTKYADKYIDMIESHVLYKNDESSLTPGTPYCVAINMYPFIEDGMTKLGGESKAPKHLESFCGSFNNLIFAISSQFNGAVAAVEFLLYFHHFAKKDYGREYLKTHADMIKSKLQHVIYTLNQPAAARGYQSVFFNLSVFDRYFFESMFGHFYFPDGDHVDYDEYNEFQKFFMEWLLEERTKSLLTFPVVTEASLNENGKPKDKEWAYFCADIRSRGLSFFSFNDDTPSALASCCRLKNELDENDFSYSLGAGGVSTGSTSVMTLNVNRFVQDVIGEAVAVTPNMTKDEKNNLVLEKLASVVEDIQKFQVAHRKIVRDYVEAKLLSAYTAGFISLDKQFVTIGINGLNEAAEFLGMTCSNNEEYLTWVANFLACIRDKNKEAKEKYGIKFNTELIPAENLGPKNAKWDIADGYVTKRNCYNSYIYLPEDDKTSIPDKFQMHGGIIADSLDGGSALHLNLAGLPDRDFFLWLRDLAAKYHTTYWTTNVKSTCCNDCGHIDARTLSKCPKCGSENLDFATRIIGYCKKISSYSPDRQEEEKLRYYH